MNIFKVFRNFSSTFWVANTMELFERWAFYGFFMLFANYLTMSTDTGALGLSQTEKGIIMSVGTAILYLIPILSGAIADRVGFKKMLFLAYIVYFASFIIMPLCKSFVTVFLNYIFLAVGAALFKPIISATVARTTNKDTVSLGFGIFYLMVNIGAFIGPLVALQFSDTAFYKVFYFSAALILLNALILLFYKEPQREHYEGSLLDAIKLIFKNIFTALKDKRFTLFLIIISGFWAMYYQLFQTLSVFILQWVDTSIVYRFLEQNWPWLAEKIGSENGTIQAEYFTNTDALFIIAFQLAVSYFVMKWRPINAMITGFIVSSIGMGLTLMTNNGFFIVASIFVFGVGEMMGSPKITEYIGRIAPKGKTALYMGFSFLPVAFGSLMAGVISGPIYQYMSDKTTIIKKEFANRSIEIPEFSNSFTQNDLIAKACNDFNMSTQELNMYLWDKYNPSNIWMVIVAVGMISALSLFFYDKTLKNKEDATN